MIHAKNTSLILRLLQFRKTASFGSLVPCWALEDSFHHGTNVEEGNQSRLPLCQVMNRTKKNQGACLFKPVAKTSITARLSALPMYQYVAPRDYHLRWCGTYYLGHLPEPIFSFAILFGFC